MHYNQAYSYTDHTFALKHTKQTFSHSQSLSTMTATALLTLSTTPEEASGRVKLTENRSMFSAMTSFRIVTVTITLSSLAAIMTWRLLTAA